MASLQPVRGTHDLLPEAMRAHRSVIGCARDVAERYGFEEMATPIFESSDVFRRTLGDTSDIVTKEMYTFTTKGGEEITLRPENTAGVARCFISEGLAQSTPLKFFYAGPMFRHERPQKGRLRQFHQIGIETVGFAGPQADIEIIAAGARILSELGLQGKTVLQLNTLGDSESRSVYREALVTYFTKRVDELSQESRDRLNRNPLRILDSKNEGDRSVVADAPSFTNHLNEESRAFFEQVQEGLTALGIAFELNERLVRGLDYYGHTAFEFTTTELGAQGAVMAGGRYDGLIETMGGPKTPGIGWAAGVERLAMLRGDPPPARRPVALVPLGAAAEARAFVLAEELRASGLRVDVGFSGNLGRRMKRADRMNAAAAVLIGDDELAKDVATVRDMDGGEQEEVPLGALRERLSGYL
uniref:Histidine--tRNA ligase n=1 Tax=uncultured Rhodospirillales bacterium HF0070_31K06 TaxID=710786 RepID=E0XSQ0_9PROT|nr:histidyl-tRNA synthetase [uncultured Rhodospirillales bacterium HF0070_31K06]